MIVEAIQDKFFFDSPNTNSPETEPRIEKGEPYIVYAIEGDKEGHETYFVIKARGNAFPALDPLPYPADCFTVITDRVTSEWESRSDASGYIKSFEEWLAPAPDGMHERALDWGLDNKDHKIINHHKRRYERHLYDKMIRSWGKMDVRNKYVDTFFGHLTKAQKEEIYFNQYMWHAFTYRTVKAEEGEAAVEKLRKKKKNSVYVLFENDATVIEKENITYEEIFHNIFEGDWGADCYVVDKGFKWTFVFTHESWVRMAEVTDSGEVIDTKGFYIGPFFKSLE